MENPTEAAKTVGDAAIEIATSISKFVNCHGVDMESKFFVAKDGSKHSTRYMARKRNKELAEQKDLR